MGVCLECCFVVCFVVIEYDEWEGLVVGWFVNGCFQFECEDVCRFGYFYDGFVDVCWCGFVCVCGGKQQCVVNGCLGVVLCLCGVVVYCKCFVWLVGCLYVEYVEVYVVDWCVQVG